MKRKDSHTRFTHLPDRVMDKAFRELNRGKKTQDIRLLGEALKRRKKLKNPASWPNRPNLYFQDRINELNNRKYCKACFRLTWNKKNEFYFLLA